jgi:hypothetical protein
MAGMGGGGRGGEGEGGEKMWRRGLEGELATTRDAFDAVMRRRPIRSPLPPPPPSPPFPRGMRAPTHR